MHGVNVRALAPYWWEKEISTPADLTIDAVAVKVIARTHLHYYLNQVRRPMAELRRGPFAQMLKTLAREVDVIHLEETENAYGAEDLPNPSSVHLHSLVRRDRPLGWPWQSDVRWGLETLLAERAALRNHRYLVASSPVVAEELRGAAPHAEVVLAPLTLDPSYYPIADLTGPPTAGLIGTASWPPTRRAMKRLIERVWPRVHRRLPEARLLLAGRRLDEFLPDAGGIPGVQALGEVPSTSDFLRQLSVLLYPLDRGSGMKVKVLESIASGVPVVTTTVGAEGILADGGVVVEDDDERLAALTVEVLTDDHGRRERGTAARRLFESRYTPRLATEPLVHLFSRMAQL